MTFPNHCPNPDNISPNQFTILENPSAIPCPKDVKNSPIPDIITPKELVNRSQKLEKKLTIAVISSWILLGIELIAFQILSSKPVVSSSLSSVSPVVFPPVVVFPSVAPPEEPPVEPPEKALHQ